MSDFHDALRRAAQEHGEKVAPSLTADAVVTLSVDGISRGRRRRATAQAGVAAFGVAVLGVGGWLVLPLASDSEPADSDPVQAGPWRYEVPEDRGDVPIEEPEVMLRGDDEVMCGDELSLEPGVTVHDSDAFGRQLYQEAELTTLGDTVGTPPGEPRPLDSNEPDGIMTGWDPNRATWDGAIGGRVVGTETVSLLMDGDTVVGHTFGSSLSGSFDGLVGGSGGGSIPRMGECEGSELTVEEYVELEVGDPMDTLLVTQFWGGPGPGERVALGERVLLATMVFDPNEPANFTETPSIDALSSTPEPTPTPTSDEATDDHAVLRDPDGTSYQAFIVERPEPGCAPLADLLAAGEPSVERAEYAVELPIVGELDGELWGAEPVVTLPAGEEPWYIEEDAWLVADDVSAGIQDPPLEWESLPEGGWALASGGESSIHDPECAYVQPIPEIDGSVFLVIDGVDWDATGIQVQPGAPVEDFQTWVYLGEGD